MLRLQGLGIAFAIRGFVVVRNHLLNAGGQTHANCHLNAHGHMLAKAALLDRAEMVGSPTQAVWQCLLANVVQQGTQPDVAQDGRVQLHGAAQQQGHDGDIEGMQGTAITGRLGQQPDTGFLAGRHFIQETADQRLGALQRCSGLTLGCRHDLLPGGRAFTKQPLAARETGRLLVQQLALFSLQGVWRHGGRTGRHFGGDGWAFTSTGASTSGKHRAGALRTGRLKSLGITPARQHLHLLEPEACDLLDLLLGRNLETVQRKRVLYPAQIKMDKHARTQFVNVDGQLGQGSFHGQR